MRSRSLASLRMTGVLLTFVILSAARDLLSQSLQYRSPDGIDYRAQADTGPIARAEAALGADPRNVDRIIALGVARFVVERKRRAL